MHIGAPRPSGYSPPIIRDGITCRCEGVRDGGGKGKGAPPIGSATPGAPLLMLVSWMVQHHVVTHLLPASTEPTSPGRKARSLNMRLDPKVRC